MEQTPIVSYEVYVLDRGRWTLQMRFRGNEREVALAEAQSAERRLSCPVKVVREVYDPAFNTADESVVYLSPRLQSRPSHRPAPLPAERVRRPAPRPAPEASQTAAPSRILITFRVLLVIAIALSISIFVVGMASVVMVQLEGLGVQLSRSAYSQVIFIMFIAGFLFSAMPLSLYFLREVDLPESSAPQRRRRARRAPVVPDTKEAREAEEKRSEPVTLPEVEEAGPAPDQAEEETAGDENAAEEDGKADADADADGKSDADDDSGGDDAAGDDDDDAEGDDDDPAAAQDESGGLAIGGAHKARLAAMRFLSEVLATLKKDTPQLDNYTRFGLHLTMAGAVERLGERMNLPPRARRRLLREVVRLLGASPAMAQSFARNYQEYLLEPRYLDMVRAGRESLRRYLEGGERPLEELVQALAIWNRPTPVQAGQRIIAVLFTDMVGSTDMTQRLGDLGAQEVVRRHNSIVRQALAEHEGREVKHTGDGIMASFPSAGEAVEAAMKIQRMVAEHNARRPELPFHLRIGINAGEPVQEEEDLFGSTVQLAARVCAQAGSDQILVTNVVRELALSAARHFRHTGLFPLKGFAEPQALYEALWREEDIAAAKAAAAPAPDDETDQPDPSVEQTGSDASEPKSDEAPEDVEAVQAELAPDPADEPADPEPKPDAL